MTSQAQVISKKTSAIRLDGNTTHESVRLPTITWMTPISEVTHSKEQRVVFEMQVTSPVPLDKVTLNLKSRLEEEPMSSLPIDFPKGSMSTTLDKEIMLLDGQNYIEIVAETNEGGVVSSYRSILVGMDAIADAISIDRNDYALLFATDVYEHWDDLTNPVYDAETIAGELEDRYGFTVDIIKNASDQQVLTTLREYNQRNFRPQDQLFIFFAGHGQYDEVFKEGYVVARNSLKNDPGKTSYVSYNRIRQIIDQIPSEHIFLVMDVCYGGTFDELVASRALYDDIDRNEFIVDKLSIKTRKYLTSGGKTYVPDGTPGNHSPFAKRFIEALRTNGGNDQVLTVAEIGVSLQKLPTTPQMGSFGTDEKGSEFLFIVK